MKKVTLILFILVLNIGKSFADEGMWLPQLLQTLNEKNMKKSGMKINASDIYSISKNSLKDAIVSFGGFCTAEVISDQGLLLTNHHCGFDAVQNHSSIQNNYIQNGFWAYNTSQELQNPGLFVSFIISINDVTKSILKGISSSLSEKERQSAVDANIAELKKNYKKESYQDIIIKPFFEGNQYFLFVTETYKDVRLVGAPPVSIGNFGKDTDNWMWPRHTGDFSMFRIYADKNNRPAEFSPENVPYKPKRSLSISLKGVKEGDFNMVFGFPGRTNEYLPSSAIKQIMNVSDPAKIKIRHEVLSVLKSFMIKDEGIKIQYAAKYATIENAYKKWQGEVLGLTKTDALTKKENYEQLFMSKVNSDSAIKPTYSGLLKNLSDKYNEIESLSLARDYYNEIIPRIEMFNVAATLKSLMASYEQNGNSSSQSKNEKTLAKLDDIFKEYNHEVDKQLFINLMTMYVKNLPEENISPMLKSMLKDNTMSEIADQLYTSSVINVNENIKNIIAGGEQYATKIISEDTLYKLYNDISNTYAQNISFKLTFLQNEINRLQREYMKAQMEVFKEKTFYPDANSTLRVAYGNVKGYQPRDGMKYDFYTYLDGVMEKYKPGDYEFDLPEKLIKLYQDKDFGNYGVNGRQPVCFIAANHTTGGNSGSPALDAYGNLIGLNFDRVWEGTMSDINYDPSICRNIMVDIRYVLFIIDKYADAKNLINEMKIVKK